MVLFKMQDIKRYFIDLEFIEDGKTIQLISIGIVEGGTSELNAYRAIDRDCDFTKADRWVRDNVLKPLNIQIITEGDRLKAVLPRYQQDFKTKQEIRSDIVNFLNLQESDRTIEIWADYGHYDYVSFCQIFGKMIDLPEGLPFFACDIQSYKVFIEDIARRKGDNLEIELPPDLETEGDHDCLKGAISCRQRHEYLSSILDEVLQE